MRLADNRPADFKHFISCFEEATANVGQDYILLPIATSPLPVYRERVYCYELYHQLRLSAGDNFGYSFGGEVDKTGHPLMRGRDLTNAKPDLLVHKPGDMGGNLVVIEVKPVAARRSAIRKDLRTLTAFRRVGKYYRAIYLLYGSEVEKLYAFTAKARSLQKEDTDNRIELDAITLYWHRNAGFSAERIEWGAGEPWVAADALRFARG